MSSAREKNRLSVRVENLGLAAYLIALAWQPWAPRGDDSLHSFDAALYALATALLVAAVVGRPEPRRRDSRPSTWALCVTSSLYFLAFDGGQAPAWIVALHVVGDSALIYLWKSFSLLPALREVRTGFVYRWIRHPAYATYIAADGALLLRSFSLWNLAVALLGASLLITRARREEELLGADPAYRAYRRATPWRFFPGLY